MNYREKVIKGLECCKWSRQNVKPENQKCDECPYRNETIMNAYAVWRSCTNVLSGDALALLKEHEPVPADTKVMGMPNGTDSEVSCCPNCRSVLDPAFGYCPYCGQAVKWE